MATILDLITPAQGTLVVRELFTQALNDMFLSRYLPTVNVNSIKVRVRTQTNSVIPAKWRVYDAETPVTRRAAQLNIMDLTIPPIGSKIRLSEEEQHMLIAAAQAPGGLDGTVATLFEDLGNLTRGIVATLEQARGDLLTDGVMALPIESGQTLDIDFATPSTHRPTPTVLWSNVGGSPTPLSDELNWINVLRTDGLGFGEIREAVTSSRIFALLQANPEYRAAYYGAGNNAPGTLNPDQVRSVRATWGLPPIVVNDEMINGARVIPDNRFLLMPDQLGETQMGPTLEARNLQAAQGNLSLRGIPVPGLVGVVQSDGDPAAIWTKVAATALPLLFDPNRYFCATVAS